MTICLNISTTCLKFNLNSLNDFNIVYSRENNFYERKESKNIIWNKNNGTSRRIKIKIKINKKIEKLRQIVNSILIFKKCNIYINLFWIFRFYFIQLKMYGNWLTAPFRSDFILIKSKFLNPAQKIRQFIISFAEFGWEMTNV